VSDVIREQRGANHMGFEVVEPDGGTRREPKVIARQRRADADVLGGRCPVRC